MSIFVQIAAQRDPELIKTIEDCLANADKPDQIVFGICNQQHDDDAFLVKLNKWRSDARFRILDVPCKETKGACWARAQIQKMYKDELYTLQIDSHMRFQKSWDTLVIQMFEQLLLKSKKPILTAQVPSQNPEKDPAGRVLDPWRMVADKFTPEGCVFFLPEVIPNWRLLKEPPRAQFFSAHFAFTWGSFCRDILQDPSYYFHGEEISIAVRAYTHGWDLQHPHRIIAWHEQTRSGRRKHWDDDPTWWMKNEACHARNRQLLCVDKDPLKQNPVIGTFDLGSARSLRRQERQAGLCFGLRKFTPQTLAKREPPEMNDTLSDEEWLALFGPPKGFPAVTTPACTKPVLN